MLGLHNAAPLDGVLAGKGRSQQQYSRIGEMDARIHPVGELVGMPTERAHEVTVASVEADHDVVEGRPDIIVGQREDAFEHHFRSGLLKLEALLAGHEEQGNHARRIRHDPVRVARDEPDRRQRHSGITVIVGLAKSAARAAGWRSPQGSIRRPD